MKRKESKIKRTRVVTKANKEGWIPGIKDADLEKLLAQRARMNRGTVLSGKGKRTTPGFIFMRPVCDGPDCDWPDPDNPKDPCAGQSWVWQPDIAAQLITGNPCPSAGDLARIEQALRGNLSPFHLPDPDVRVSCQGGIISILIWGTRVQPKSCNDLARSRAQIPPDIAKNGNFGLYFNAGLIRRLAQEAFVDAPKTLGADGRANPNGPIHLTGLSVGFKAPNIIETYVSGFDDRPWPDVSFTTTLTDHLLDLRGCNPESKTDTSTFDEILALLLDVLPSAFSLWLIPLSGFLLYKGVDAALNHPHNPAEGGVGCRMLEALPAQISLPQTGGILPPIPVSTRRVSTRLAPPNIVLRPEKKKLVIPYNAPRIDDRGLLVSAIATIEDRTPTVQVIGPSGLSIDVNAAETFGYYRVQPEDFYGDLSFSWSAGSNVIVHSPNQPSTKISFRRGNTQPGNGFERTVTVRVTDIEGSSVTASLTVGIYVIDIGDNLPPICKIKPWLRQCQPGGPD